MPKEFGVETLNRSPSVKHTDVHIDASAELVCDLYVAFAPLQEGGLTFLPKLRLGYEAAKLEDLKVTASTVFGQANIPAVLEQAFLARYQPFADAFEAPQTDALLYATLYSLCGRPWSNIYDAELGVSLLYLNFITMLDGLDTLRHSDGTKLQIDVIWLREALPDIRNARR
jgi:hypothetical protein